MFIIWSFISFRFECFTDRWGWSIRSSLLLYFWFFCWLLFSKLVVVILLLIAHEIYMRLPALTSYTMGFILSKGQHKSQHSQMLPMKRHLSIAQHQKPSVHRCNLYICDPFHLNHRLTILKCNIFIIRYSPSAEIFHIHNLSDEYVFGCMRFVFYLQLCGFIRMIAILDLIWTCWI